MKILQDGISILVQDFKKEHNATRFPKITKPEWNGIKDISKSTLLVYYEQGFGDTFLMWGYMTRLTQLCKTCNFCSSGFSV